ncbi:MAG: hypothetical protein WCH04_11295 [Gammaproteobacteria bacterium]
MGEPARILTIEDEQPVRSGIVAYLQESGFSVLEATDGLSGIATFRASIRTLFCMICTCRV